MSSQLAQDPTPSTFLSVKAGATACTVLMIGLPLAAAAYWLLGDSATLLGSYAGLAGSQTISLFQRISGLAVSLFPIGVVAFMLWVLRDLLQQISRSGFISLGSAQATRRLSFGAAAYATAIVLTHTALSIILTLGAPEGHKVIELAVSSETLILYVVSAILLLVSLMVDRAVDIQDDNAMII